MAILSGDSVEKVLWDNGFDFTYQTIKMGDDDFEVEYFDVTIGDCHLQFLDTWTEGDGWFLDTDNVSVCLFSDYCLLVVDIPDFTDEEGLLSYLYEMGTVYACSTTGR